MKSTLRRLAKAIGYDLVRKDRGIVRPENFANLAGAYERELNRGAAGPCPPGNERRPVLMGRLLGTQPSQAYAILVELAATADVPGAVCEFGVAHGETSALIANEIADGDKMLHLFDSFEGLPAPTEKDQLKDDIFSLGSMAAYEGKMACKEDFVIGRLEGISFPPSRYRIHKGFIERLVEARVDFPTSVSFAYVDFDFYEPIRVALDFLDEVLSPGGVVMVDDYDYFSTGAKTAVTEFLEGAGTGQGEYVLEVADEALGRFALLRRR